MKDCGFGKLYLAVMTTGLWAVASDKAKAVYAVLVAHCSDKSGESYPGVDLIARESGVNKRTVPKATRELVDLGLIAKRRKARGNNVYDLVRGEDLAKKNLKASSAISKKAFLKRRVFKLRGSNGRFLQPPPEMEIKNHDLKVGLCPSAMDKDSPSAMEIGAPSEMDSNRGIFQRKDNQSNPIFNHSNLEKTNKTNELNSALSDTPRLIHSIANITLFQVFSDAGVDGTRDKLKEFGIDESEINSAISAIEKLRPSLGKSVQDAEHIGCK